MKVLHICSYYIGSKLYRNLILNLEVLGIENNVYIPVSSSELIGINDSKDFKKTNLIYSNSFKNIDRLNFKVKSKKMYKNLLKEIDFENLDIIHAHSLFTNGYLAYRLKKEKNIDYIVAIRNTDINIFFRYMPHMRKLGLEIMNNAKKVIFISQPYKDYFIEKYAKYSEHTLLSDKIEVIPNGIDSFWFNNMNSSKKTKKLKLLYVGTLNKNKNIISIIKAVNKLRQKGYKLELEIVGDGPYYKKIDKRIKKHKEYIHLNGKLNSKELLEKYRECNIFVMPSKYETFGLVYVEALTQGLPVIYTKGQGFDGIYEDGNVGYSVEYGNLLDLTNSIEKLINEDIELDKYKKDLKEKFMWINIAKKYYKLYN
ncbi:MAG TPA: hypothetical protein DDY58_13095 [Terrisporobacter glycolicus]|uniref:glycosyltransferase family 4 protein n=1 Tax=Terrisporobacter TaxID=1505652 RepID=UPI000E89147B|nr:MULTISPECIES: glycosyltransferase family 4 protein [Terrisporobacter]HBI93267.1 hypothetical protein [Terrisporobacter hibernicus]